ncbi:MAG: DUF86 domain-containing protein [Bacteroidales bacterium]|nr:DUF86 domain-containing protein [Bacteroidales bacterium]
MREPVRDKERLHHIYDAINRIQNRIPTLDLESLLQDVLIYYGVVKNIEIIGEAVYKLSQEFKEEHTMAAWEDIEGMRHVLVHDYYNIQPGRVLPVIENDLPSLKAQIEQYLSEMGEQ